MRIDRLLPLLLLAACQAAPPGAPANDAAAAADDGLPVRPGVYGNVAGGKGLELQVHKPPRNLVELTLCDHGCKPVRRVPYMIEGKAMTLGLDGATLRLSQQGEDLTAEGVGPAPLLLKHLPKRDGLAQAEEAVRATIR